MSTVLLDMAISLDGCIGRTDGADAGLYDWYFDPPPASAPVIDELIATTGAIVIGRGAYGTGDGATGWDDTPYAVKHVVLTHRPPARSGGPVDFAFVADLRAALDTAAAAAGGRWVTVGGGADVARQFLAAGLVDELQLHLVPVVVGRGGIRLFDDSVPAQRLRARRVIASTGVTHLRYTVDPA